ncbi:hypothetical protein BWQ96_05182 [Gracilariopsis chorda]|uniref:Uncharacterized protein n=1 Tax=Gracilariopsis chorda TaxID=448386 RepID=A0A2V3IVB4_9FLOR|nr:hypothetical protein BWQ96_05182 [Gracilariopsis chorda]|eukprot:PXF45080.1 hypothetical protein BWQ96_05182 [Gracilariopsis chorda]
MNTLDDCSVISRSKKACENVKGFKGVYYKYNAPFFGGTWTLVVRESSMEQVLLVLVLKKELINGISKTILKKASYCLKGHMQENVIHSDADTTYTLVTLHKTLRILLSIAAASDLLLEERTSRTITCTEN